MSGLLSSFFSPETLFSVFLILQPAPKLSCVDFSPRKKKTFCPFLSLNCMMIDDWLQPNFSKIEN